jgi:hypothetical protein
MKLTRPSILKSEMRQNHPNTTGKIDFTETAVRDIVQGRNEKDLREGRTRLRRP